MGYDLYWQTKRPDAATTDPFTNWVYGGRVGTLSTSFTCPFQGLAPYGIVASCNARVEAVNQYGSSDGAVVGVSFGKSRPVRSLLGHRHDDSRSADPVSMATGNLTDQWVDVSAPSGAWSMDFARAYNSRDSKLGVLGTGWSTVLDVRLTLNPDGSYTYRDWDGREVDFATIAGGGWLRPEEVDAQLSVNATGPVLSWFSGEVWQFDTAGLLLSQSGWEGQSVTYTRMAGLVSSMASSAGYSLSFTYAAGRLTQVTSATGRTVVYGYNGSSVLTSVTVDGRLVQSIIPDGSGRLGQLNDPTGVVLMANTFDASGRVLSQSSAASSAVTFTYDSSAADRDVTTMTDTVTGAVARFEFDKGGRLLRSVDPAGFASGSSYDVDGNRTATDTRTGDSSFAAFDSSGRPTQIVTDKAGSTGIVYDTFGRVSTITDTFGRTTTYTYDGAERLPSTTIAPDGTVTAANVVNGLVMSTTDADGVVTNFTYNPQRRLATSANAFGNTSSYTYTTKGQIATVTDPTGAVTTNGYDAAGRLTTVTDPYGKVTTYTYDNADRLLTVTDSTGAVTTNAYDSAGRLLTVTDPANAVTTNAYDTAGRLKTVTAPGGAVTTCTYDLLNRVATMKDPLNRITTYGYDADGRPTKVTDPTGATTETVYDGSGRAAVVRDPLGRVTQNAYDVFGRLVSVTDPLGQLSTMTYDNRDRVASTTDQRGAVTNTTYTPAGRVKTTTAVATGIFTTNTYDLAGRRSKVTGPTGDIVFGFDPDGRTNSTTTPGGLVSSSTFDKLGRVLTATIPAGVVTTKTWSDRGQLLTTATTGAGTVTNVYNPDRTLKQVSDANGKTTTFGYDGRKNQTTRTNALAGVDARSYDLANQLLTVTDPLNRSTTYTYDPVGRTATVTDPTARKLTYSYDAAGQAITKAVTGGATYQSSYDLLGRRTSVVAAGQTWTSTWAPGNLLTSQIDPNGHATGWSYDTAGRMTAMVYPDGSSVNDSYDSAGRLATITPGEMMADSFTATTGTAPDPAKWIQTLTGGATGSIQTNTAKLTTVNTVGSTAALISQAPASADLDAAVTYTATDTTTTNATDIVLAVRQAGGNDYRLTLPSIAGTATLASKVGTTITSLGTFTIAGTGARRARLQAQGTTIRARVWQADQPEPATWSLSVTNSAVTTAGTVAMIVNRTAGANSVRFDNYTQTNPTTPQPVVAAYSYNLDSQYTGETLTGGSRTWTYTTGRVTNYSQTLAATTTATGLTYDSTGRIRTETTGPMTNTYSYDLASQLTASTPSAGQATSYTYDALGRRAATTVGTTTTTDTYDTASQLTGNGTSTYTYDTAGRRASETTGGTVTNHTYDPQGRLQTTSRAATTVTRGYDPDDNLISVTNSASVTGIDWNPTAGLSQPSVLGGNRLIRGPDGWLTTRTGLTDTLIGRTIYGSPTSPIAVARAASYDQFGTPAGAATWTPTLGYRGEITIDTLTYLRARNYDTANGVFASRDPIDGTAGSPVLANPYHYGSNNPLSNTDPTGLSNVGDNLFGFETDPWSTTRPTWQNQILVDGQWINKAVLYDQLHGQALNEMEQAFAELQRLDNIGVTGTVASVVGSQVAGFTCAAGGALAGPVVAGGAFGLCAGVTGRLTTSVASGAGIHDSIEYAGNVNATKHDVLQGAAYGALFALAGELVQQAKSVAGASVPAERPQSIPSAPEAGTAGRPVYPPNRGFEYDPIETTLKPGASIDRYGPRSGTFASPEGTPFGQRSLPASAASKPYEDYVVLKPIEGVNMGLARPWFGQPGLGVQYELPAPIQQLIDDGFLGVKK